MNIFKYNRTYSIYYIVNNYIGIWKKIYIFHHTEIELVVAQSP